MVYDQTHRSVILGNSVVLDEVDNHAGAKGIRQRVRPDIRRSTKGTLDDVAASYDAATAVVWLMWDVDRNEAGEPGYVKSFKHPVHDVDNAQQGCMAEGITKAKQMSVRPAVDASMRVRNVNNEELRDSARLHKAADVGEILVIHTRSLLVQLSGRVQERRRDPSAVRYAEASLPSLGDLGAAVNDVVPDIVLVEEAG